MSAELSPPAPRPFWGRASAACAVIAVLAPIAIGFIYVSTESARPAPPESGPQAQNEAWAWLGRMLVTFVYAVLAAGLSSLAGVVAGVIAVGRGERPGWPAWFGLCVCAPIVVVLLAAVVNGEH